MSNRIDQTFARLRNSGRKAFVAYVAAGDPGFEASLGIIHALADAGADVIELGMPFSDPLADGIVNQMAADRALKAGMTTARTLDLVRRFRETNTTTPIVLFTYLNPIFTYGFGKFHNDAAAVGADGVLLLDLPPDECDHDVAAFTGDGGLKIIRLIAPTTPPGRLQRLAELAEGFIYALSRTGVTGAHGAPSADVPEFVSAIRAHASVPVCVGFGISTADQAAAIARVADGVVVGSAIVKVVEQNASGDPVAAVREFVTPLIEAVHGVPGEVPPASQSD